MNTLMDPMPVSLTCVLCGHVARPPAPTDLGCARGNTARFKHLGFRLWKCPHCHTIHAIDPVADYAKLYRDYPPNRRRLDVFARGTLANLCGRLERAGGLDRGARILDYGCGNGLFLEFLRARGYRDVTGYDPYHPDHMRDPGGDYDCVVANDVIEHVDDPRALLADCAARVRPGGLLYVGTADAGPVDMQDLEPQLMRLHQPFHRVILTEAGLHRLARETGFDWVAHWRRSYMDTLRPFANYRFLDAFNAALGHDMDRAMDPAAARVLLRRPDLLFWALFGYFLPCAYEPAVLLRKPLAAQETAT